MLYAVHTVCAFFKKLNETDELLCNPLLSTQTKIVNNHYKPVGQKPHPHGRMHLSVSEVSIQATVSQI